MTNSRQTGCPLLKRENEYNQEIPQSQAADKSMAFRGRVTQQSRETMETN